MIERLQRRIGQAGYVLVVVGLGGGTVLYLMDYGALSRTVLAATLVVLLVLPVVNVLAAVVEEILQREWLYVVFACVVLVLLGVAILR